MTWAELQEVVDRIRYKDWCLTLTDQHMGCPGLPVIYWNWNAPCVNTGQPSWQAGRPWVVYGMDRDAVIKTAFGAAKMAELHECAEHFTFNGQRVFDPHKGIDA